MYQLPEFEITSQAKRLNVDAYRTAGALPVCTPGRPSDLFSGLMFPKLLSEPMGFWLSMVTGQQMSCCIYRTRWGMEGGKGEGSLNPSVSSIFTVMGEEPILHTLLHKLEINY